MGVLDSFIAFDTETTGFGPTARILEIAVVVFEQGEPVHAWEQLLCPEGVDWGSENVQKALAVNKIDPKDLQGKPTFKQVFPDLMLELSSDIWVAHNASFDIQMIQQEAQRIQKLVQPPPLVACTLQLAAYRTNAKNNKLADVAARYSVLQDGAHRAAADATVCGRIFREMIRKDEIPPTVGGMKDLIQAAEKAWKTRSKW